MPVIKSVDGLISGSAGDISQNESKPFEKGLVPLADIHPAPGKKKSPAPILDKRDQPFSLSCRRKRKIREHDDLHLRQQLDPVFPECFCRPECSLCIPDRKKSPFKRDNVFPRIPDQKHTYFFRYIKSKIQAVILNKAIIHQPDLPPAPSCTMGTELE